MFELIPFPFPDTPGTLVVRTYRRPAQVSCETFPTILLLYVYLVQGRISDSGDSRIMENIRGVVQVLANVFILWTITTTALLVPYSPRRHPETTPSRGHSSTASQRTWSHFLGRSSKTSTSTLDPTVFQSIPGHYTTSAYHARKRFPRCWVLLHRKGLPWS